MREYRGLTWGDWLYLYFWKYRNWLRRCPECDQRGYDPGIPRWKDDPTVRALGFSTSDRCPECGKKPINESSDS